MQRTQETKNATIVLFAIGILLFGLGVATYVHPQIMERYGVAVDTPHAVSTVRSLVGGAEIALGSFLLAGGRLGVSLRSRLLLAIFVFGGLVIARGASMLLAQGVLPITVVRELVAEVFILAVAVWAYTFPKRRVQ